MPEDVRIRFDRVWKRFRRGSGHDSLRDLIPGLVKKVVRREPAELGSNEFWALRDVSFEVRAGEALGIIGRNGAGKSTTLKILTRVLAPTRGLYGTAGRVGSLIEVAAGFHPDLTGRDNIYLQAAILGMPRERIEVAFDSIVDFAGVESFIDTPVKRYSSGMNARLGFAIAAHLEPDVLIIDEVLSVGDMAFQAKCIERMRQFKREGVAIVFVSHNMQAVGDLCEHTVHLDGTVVQSGPTGEVISGFLTSLGQAGDAENSGPARISGGPLQTAAGEAVDAVPPGTELRQSLSLTVRESLGDCSLSMVLVRSTDGLIVFDDSVQVSDLGWSTLEPGQTYTVDARFVAHLLRGQYHVQWHLTHNPTLRFLAILTPAALFRIDEYRSYGGVADLQLTVHRGHE